MLSFTTAHVAVLVLRFKEPDRARPYRAPMNFRWRGTLVSLTPLLGAIGTFAAWLSVVALHVEARTVGIGWMVVGLAGYVVYRRRSGLDLTTAVKIERGERPPDFIELGYRSVLVPIFGGDVSAKALRAAAKLAGEDARVDALFVLGVPAQLSLHAGLDEEERQGWAVLEAAKLAGRSQGLHVRTSLLRTRNPGHTIVEEARRLSSEVIYLSTTQGAVTDGALGPLATYLLAHRPCRIVIASSPASRNGHQRVAPPLAAAGAQR